MERLVETEPTGLEVLHPGGLALTRELAERCAVDGGSAILDVACGTGESACRLAETFGAVVTALDRSPRMTGATLRKATGRGLPVRTVRGDAHRLPFPDGTFDVVTSECAMTLLDAERALGEMARVAAPGGRVGLHDLCWTDATSEETKERLLELEGERARTLDGWARLLEEAGLGDVRAVDRSEVVPAWMDEVAERLGASGRLRLGWRALRRWGPGGLRRVLRTEGLFRSGELGYGLLVGTKGSEAG